MKRSMLPIALAVAISGCAGTTDLPAQFSLNAASGEGVAVVGATLAGVAMDKVSAFELSIRPLEAARRGDIVARRYFDSTVQHARWAASGPREPHASDKKAVVKGVGNADGLDISEDARAGRVMALRLAPGDYEIYSWTVQVPDQYGGTEFRPPADFSYRFTVPAGEAVYVGRLDIDMDRKGLVTTTDQRAKDLALFAQRSPLPVSPAIGKLVTVKK